MKKEYDLSKMSRRRNPFAQQLKAQATVGIEADVFEYFQKLAEEAGMPCHSLINFYLRECMTSQRRLSPQ